MYWANESFITVRFMNMKFLAKVDFCVKFYNMFFFHAKCAIYWRSLWQINYTCTSQNFDTFWSVCLYQFIFWGGDTNVLSCRFKSKWRCWSLKIGTKGFLRSITNNLITKCYFVVDKILCWCWVLLKNIADPLSQFFLLMTSLQNFRGVFCRQY